MLSPSLINEVFPLQLRLTSWVAYFSLNSAVGGDMAGKGVANSGKELRMNELKLMSH